MPNYLKLIINAKSTSSLPKACTSGLNSKHLLVEFEMKNFLSFIFVFLFVSVVTIGCVNAEEEYSDTAIQASYGAENDFVYAPFPGNYPTDSYKGKRRVMIYEVYGDVRFDDGTGNPGKKVTIGRSMVVNYPPSLWTKDGGSIVWKLDE